MKKQHLYRVAAILLFLCIFLGIMPRHALQATAAEAENTFPEEGKIYYILCTYTYDDEGSDRTAYGFLDTQLNTFWESGTQTDTFVLPASGKLDADGSKNLMRGFTIEKTEDGYYKFLPVCMPGRCMQLSQKFTNGLTLRVGFYEGKPEQKWILTPQENGGYYLSNAVYPNRPLALSQGRVRPLPVYSSGHRTFTFSFVEAPLNFTANRIFVKAPEEWYPALWVEQDLSHAWHGAIAMEKCTDGWYSYMAPPGDSCKIVNLLTSYINLSHYEQDFSQYGYDDLFDLEDLDFSTDKWVVITDNPDKVGDLTFEVYDYNPDDEPPKTADPVMLAIPAFSLLASAIAMAWLLRRKTI